MSLFLRAPMDISLVAEWASLVKEILVTCNKLHDMTQIRLKAGKGCYVHKWRTKLQDRLMITFQEG